MPVALEARPVMPKIIETPGENPGALPLRTRRPGAQIESSGEPVYTIRGLQGTAAELLENPRAATFSLSVAQSIIYDHLVTLGNLTPDVAQKTADGFRDDRVRLVEGIFGKTQPSAETTWEPHKEAAELISAAAIIYQRTNKDL